MEKDDVLEQLSAAKKAHIKWVNRAKSLVEGLPVDKSAIPMDSTECQFGTWFYSDGQKLNMLTNMDCLATVETLHTKLHDTYMKIFKIYFGEDKRSFFGKLLNLKKKITDTEKEMAREHFANLEEISKKLLDEIGKLERRLYAMPNETFAEKFKS